MKRLGAIALTIGTLTGGCSGDLSILDPAGATAGRLAGLWWLMFWLGAAVWVLVVAVLVRAVAAPRSDGDAAPRTGGRGLVIGGGIVLPVVVLVPLVFVVFQVADDLSPRPTDDDVRIEVVGQQYWWEVRYTGSRAVDANEVHVPVGRPVVLELSSTDVIHSFWVPNVAGKVDLIPGEITHLRFEVSEPGVYRGVCAEFCGIQHARMRLVMIAHPSEEYDDMVSHLAEEAAAPRGVLAQDGQRVFAQTGCGTCHAVRGTLNAGAKGPDLTHLASRRTIGAGTFDNSRGNLAGWVVDPQGMKPGALMPAQSLEPDELEALLAYLEELE